MKKACFLFLSVSVLVSCVYHERSEGSRRFPHERSSRSEDSSRRRAPRVRKHQRPDSMPYLPPFTMRWDCPNEPQTLGYVTR